MNYVKKIVIALLAVVFLTSCGGGKKEENKEVKLKPESSKIKGPLSDYFEVVEKEYVLKNEGSSSFGKNMINVEVLRTDKEFDFPTDKVNPFGVNGGEDYHVGFGVEVFTDSDLAFKRNATEGGFSGPYSSDDVKNLMNLQRGETGFIRWSFNEDEIAPDLKTFKLTSALEKSGDSRSSSYGNDTEEESEISTVASASDKNWDKVLKDYEAYIDKYIALAKKAKNGDTSVLSEYASMMEKATDLQQSLSNAGGNLTPTQSAKFIKLQQKLTNAALEM